MNKKRFTKRDPQNPTDRIAYIVYMWRILNSEIAAEISEETMIKGTSIRKLSEFGGPGYLRIKKWAEGKVEELFKKHNALMDKDEAEKTEYAEGVTRDKQDHKLNYASYFYPDFLIAYGKHMKKGEIRHGAANFKGGMPPKEVLESLLRHTITLWMELEYGPVSKEYLDHLASEKIDPKEEHEMGLVFNAQQIWKWKGGNYENKLKQK